MVTGSPVLERSGATQPISSSHSQTSRTFAAKAAARAAYRGSSVRRSPYSFIMLPQPAELTTTASRPSKGVKASISDRASDLASSV